MREQSYEEGRFLIATENQDPIKGKVKLIVEGSKYVIRVGEEDSFRIVKPRKRPGNAESDGEDDDEDNDRDYNKDNAEKLMTWPSLPAKLLTKMPTRTKQ